MAWVDAKTEDRTDRHNALSDSFGVSATKERMRPPFAASERLERILELQTRNPADYARLSPTDRIAASMYAAAKAAHEAGQR